MNPLDIFKSTPAWDDRFNLPLCPDYNNPWIYLAYAVKLIKARRVLDPSEEITTRALVLKHAAKCRLTSGLFDRWPDHSGGVFSFDEMIGMAYLSPELAKELFLYIAMMDGVYCNKPLEINESNAELFNVYRFIFLEPYLRARAGLRVGILSQLKFAIHVFYSAIKLQPQDEDSISKIWLMRDEMRVFLICQIALNFWGSKLKSLGLTPKDIFNKQLEKCKVFQELAPFYWD